MRVALLTGGGDCPGLNAVIYAAVRKGINHYGDEFIGFRNGWKGVLENDFIPLTLEAVDGIQFSVAAGQVFDFDDGRVSVHRIETGKTFNIQHRTPNIQGIPPGNAPLDVRC